jgi:Domain of unknown function (DUF6265)
MKNFYMKINLGFLFISGIISSFTHAQQNKYSEKDFGSLHSLAGTWKMETPRGPMFERWVMADSHKLVGKSYKMKNADTIVLEKLELAFVKGAIFYTSVVSDQNNQRPIPFKLVSAGDNKFIFENKSHDYPQRIIYQLVSTDSVHARIEGTKNGKEMGSDFFYTRDR